MLSVISKIIVGHIFDYEYAKLVRTVSG